MKSYLERINPTALVFIAFMLLAALIAPSFLSGYTYNVVIVALIYAICVYGATIVTGMGGVISFAYITFFGFGAYWAANLTTGRWFEVTLSPFIALITAPIAVAIIGYLTGLVLFKLKGSFFVFGTIGFVNVAYVFFGNYVPIFGGASGIKHIPTLSIGSFVCDDYNKWFYVLVFIVMIAYLVVERIRRSRLGRALAAIKDNETAAMAFGIDVYKTKIYAFSIASAFCGLSGALYAMQARYISSELFSINGSYNIIIMLVLGGMNNTGGAVIGALLVRALPEIFRSLKSFLQLAYGVGIILIVVFMPNGLASLVDTSVTKLVRKKRKAGKLEEGVKE